ncbi:MAG: energy transducer TonB, partial [Sphingobacteriales bacterium]
GRLVQQLIYNGLPEGEGNFREVFRKQHLYFYGTPSDKSTALLNVTDTYITMERKPFLTTFRPEISGQKLKDPKQESTVAPEAGSQVFTFVEEMPEFKGGTSALLEYIRVHLDADSVEFEGRMLVKFIIREDGRTDNVQLIKGSGTTLDEQVIKLIRDMPAWKPGRQQGRAVPVWFTLPVQVRRD